MTKLKTVLQFVFSFIFATSACAQSTDKVAVKFLKEDFEILRKKIESSQPGLYLYTSKDSLDKIFDRMSSSLDEPMTSIEFYRKIAPLNKMLRNLHTIFWTSVAYEKASETGLPRFPLDIHWTDGQMYVLRNNSSNQSIVPGSVVRRINNKNAGSVFQTLLDCTIRDGYNESYPISRTSRDFGSYYAQLIGTPKTFTVELTKPDGDEQKLELDGVTSTEINISRVQKHNGNYSQYGEDWEAWMSTKEPALRLEMKGNIAIMTLRTLSTWIIEGHGQNYEEFIENAFIQLEANKTTDLIIDLRNNHGGHDPVAMSLMSHLHDSVFYYYKRRSTLVKPKGKAVKVGNGYEITGKGAWIGKVSPAQRIFTGNVYVLMNGYSASSTGELIGHLKNINRAIFIGEEAGGNPVIFTGGQRWSIDLPHTHVVGYLPLSLNEMNVKLKNTGHGVIPDYYVKPTITDILQEKDVEMEFVLDLIQKNRTK
jgi:C-terminal processing protease CtpA/Prc